MKGKEVEKNIQKSQDSLNKFAIENNYPTLSYKPVAIGYLDITEEYQKGPVSQNFINKLRQVWESGGRLMSCGHHDCEFCIDQDNYKGRAKGSSEKIIHDNENKIQYIFPEMIFHYIEKHDYQPPEEFVLFILATQSHGNKNNGGEHNG